MKWLDLIFWRRAVDTSIGRGKLSLSGVFGQERRDGRSRGKASRSERVVNA